MSELTGLVQRVLGRVVGRVREVELVVAALAADRHVLLEGPPGTGKTYTLKNEFFDRFTTRVERLTREQRLTELVEELTWWQVVAMVLAEAGVMGVIGGVIGLVFGIILSRIFLLSMAAMSGYKIAFILPASQVIAGFVVALVVSHLAAMFPASRAARVRILDAIQHE